MNIEQSNLVSHKSKFIFTTQTSIKINIYLANGHKTHLHNLDD